MIDIGIEAQKFMLVFFRIVSVLWLVPLFSSRYVAVVFKAGLSLLIAFLLYGSVNITIDVLKDPFSFALLVARELFIGITISFIV
jgi:flagellar biosynthesis protein FliR